MVLIELGTNSLHPHIEDEFPYLATFLSGGKQRTCGIKGRAHLVRRFDELCKGEACPSQEEKEVMIANFPDVLLD